MFLYCSLVVLALLEGYLEESTNISSIFGARINVSIFFSFFFRDLAVFQHIDFSKHTYGLLSKSLVIN